MTDGSIIYINNLHIIQSIINNTYYFTIKDQYEKILNYFNVIDIDDFLIIREIISIQHAYENISNYIQYSNELFNSLNNVCNINEKKQKFAQLSINMNMIFTSQSYDSIFSKNNINLIYGDIYDINCKTLHEKNIINELKTKILFYKNYYDDEKRNEMIEKIILLMPYSTFIYDKIEGEINDKKIKIVIKNTYIRNIYDISVIEKIIPIFLFDKESLKNKYEIHKQMGILHGYTFYDTMIKNYYYKENKEYDELIENYFKIIVDEFKKIY